MSYDVDPIAIIAALLVQQVLGFLWFAVVLRCMGWTRRLVEARATGSARNAVRTQLVAVACSGVAAIALAIVLSSVGQPSVATGSLIGFITGVGIGGSSMLTNATFDGRDQLATWMFILYQAISFSAMGAVVAALQ